MGGDLQNKIIINLNLSKENVLFILTYSIEIDLSAQFTYIETDLSHTKCSIELYSYLFESHEVVD